MVIYYLWLIQPFVEILQILYRGQDKSKAFLQEPEPEEQWSDSKDEEDGDNQDKTNVIEQSDDEGGGEGDGNKERLRDLFKSKKARPSNLDRFQGTNRVRRVMQREMLDRIDARISISIQRHVYLTI